MSYNLNSCHITSHSDLKVDTQKTYKMSYIVLPQGLLFLFSKASQNWCFVLCECKCVHTLLQWTNLSTSTSTPKRFQLTDTAACDAIFFEVFLIDLVASVAIYIFKHAGFFSVHAWLQINKCLMLIHPLCAYQTILIRNTCHRNKEKWVICDI